MSGPVAAARAENMWRVIRKLQTFTVADVRLCSYTTSEPVSEDDAAAFIRMLIRAGYLRCIRERIPFFPAQYCLIRRTGPVPPVEKWTRAVSDPDRGADTHLPEPGQ